MSRQPAIRNDAAGHGTIALVATFALWQRARVAQSKNDPARSAFTKAHGEASRSNRPGTDH